MTQIKTLNQAVYVAQDSIVSLSERDVNFLTSRVGQVDQKRVRLCVHQNIAEKLQEMLIALEKGSYIRPAKHIHKEESMHVIQGVADLVFLDKKGCVRDIVFLGTLASGRQFFCRIPKGACHTLLIRSKIFVFHEVAEGPFRRSNTVFPPWAPEDQNSTQTRKLMRRIETEVKNFKRKCS